MDLLGLFHLVKETTLLSGGDTRYSVQRVKSETMQSVGEVTPPADLFRALRHTAHRDTTDSYPLRG